jgi:hypothetical protein
MNQFAQNYSNQSLGGFYEPAHIILQVIPDSIIFSFNQFIRTMGTGCAVNQ